MDKIAIELRNKALTQPNPFHKGDTVICIVGRGGILKKGDIFKVEKRYKHVIQITLNKNAAKYYYHTRFTLFNPKFTNLNLNQAIEMAVKELT